MDSYFFFQSEVFSLHRRIRHAQNQLPVANENCRNKESVSLIRKIAVKGIAVKVCCTSMANLVHVITNSSINQLNMYRVKDDNQMHSDKDTGWKFFVKQPIKLHVWLLSSALSLTV